MVGGGMWYLKEYQPKQYGEVVGTARAALQAIKDATSTGSRDKVAVQVSTTPKGATIFVDGNQMGKKTPSKISLPPGDYEVELKLEGYSPVTRKVTVEKDTPLNINETLQK
jgi:hypothetical protein